MTDDNEFLVEAFRRLLAERITPEVVRTVEQRRELGSEWQEFVASGFLDAHVPEAAGGAGLGLAQLFPLLLLLGEHAVPLPVGQTMVARGLLAGSGGASAPDAAILIAGVSNHFPGGASATHALVEGDDGLGLAEISGDGIDPFGAGSASLLRDARTGEPVEGSTSTLLLAAAAVESALMAGAMARILEMSLRYAGERQQFGRPLGKFQAIQQQLAVLAEQVISAQVAARAAFGGARFEEARVAAAKVRVNEAAGHICAIAHAIHGAIGATEEFDLQLYTRRLKQGQLAFGSETFWAARLGRLRISASVPTTADYLRLNLAPGAE